MRVLGTISVYDSKSNIERIASLAKVSSGQIKKLGTKRKEPDVDSWCYSTSWHQFNPSSLDEEIYDFLTAHISLADAITTLASPSPTIPPCLTLCPVRQNNDEEFSCFLTHRTMQTISRLGLALEISPAEVMPQAPHWVLRK